MAKRQTGNEWKIWLIIIISLGIGMLDALLNGHIPLGIGLFMFVVSVLIAWARITGKVVLKGDLLPRHNRVTSKTRLKKRQSLSSKE